MAEENKETPLNVRKVTAQLVVTVTADHPAQVSKLGREIVDEALGKNIDIDGFRLSSRDTPCPSCGRMERKLTGFTPDKKSQVHINVTLKPNKQEVFEDFKERVYKALDKSDDVEVVDIREGS